MRIERLRAGAFGVLREEALDLAPGMNVVHGLNGAGKSTWHSAIYAALTGARDEQLRPWAGPDWKVACDLVLADGRRIEIEQDLAAGSGLARDVASAADVTA